MKNLTSKQIRSRLDEIKLLQEQHELRDFDAELKEVMLAGGDVDELEEAQLQSERTSRRLRVESQALEAALPDALRVEAELELKSIKDNMSAQPERIEELAREMEPLIEKLNPLLTEIMAIHRERVLSHKQVAKVIASRNLPDTSFQGTGKIVCQKAESLIQQLQSAMSSGVEQLNHKERMMYGTGAEFNTYKLFI